VYYVLIAAITITGLKSGTNPEPTPRPNHNPCSYVILPDSVIYWVSTLYTVK